MSEAHEETSKAEDHHQHDHHESASKDSDPVSEMVESTSEAIENLSLGEKSTYPEEEKTHHEAKEESHHGKKTHEAKKLENLGKHQLGDEETAMHHEPHIHSSSHESSHSPDTHSSVESTHHESHIDHHKESHEHQTVHHTPEDTDVHKHHDEPVQLHEADLENNENQKANLDHEETDDIEHSSTLSTYKKLLNLDIDEETEFLIPLHSKLKKEGKFHETLLGNYLKISGDFTSSDLLHVNGKEIKIEKFNWTSRSLQIGKDFLLFTGGNSSYTSAFVLDISDRELKEIPKLHHPRDLHAMTWIDGQVAVIGGCDETQTAVSSVEVFETEKWVDVSPLNHARYGHSATYHLGKTWVFGGAKTKNVSVQTVEVYHNHSWKVLNVKVPFQVVGAGIIGVKNSIFILGGFSINKANTSAVFKFDIKEESFEQSDDLDEPASFSQNLWRLDGDFLEGFRFRGKRISYKP